MEGVAGNWTCLGGMDGGRGLRDELVSLCLRVYGYIFITFGRSSSSGPGVIGWHYGVNMREKYVYIYRRYELYPPFPFQGLYIYTYTAVGISSLFSSKSYMAFVLSHPPCDRCFEEADPEVGERAQCVVRR